MTRRLLPVAVIAAALVAAAPAALAAKPRARSSSSTGYDVSYPQCAGPYPSGQAFGVVGVNGGLANDANSCFASELQWALSSPGLTSPSQPPASVYVNTANPGPAPGVTDWPTSGSSTAYGSCDGSWSAACSYVYGEQRAAYSYGLVYNTNASVAASDPWWLDIETQNSWATSTTPNYTQLNVAAIQGFIQGLRDPNQVPGATTSYSAGAGGPIGIYSTPSQWSQITGLGAQTTAGAFGGSAPPDWVAGARSAKQARSNCSQSFTGAPVTLAQYSSGGYDADLRCG
jgi:hypothetical protein